jgi:hypothetical protein
MLSKIVSATIAVVLIGSLGVLVYFMWFGAGYDPYLPNGLR